MVSLASSFPEDAFVVGCPTRTVLDHVMSKWAPLLIAALSDGEPLRWSELRRRAEGVSEKMLAQTLRTLEEDGFVHREALAVVPPHVEYSLTPLGSELAETPMLVKNSRAILDPLPLEPQGPTA